MGKNTKAGFIRPLLLVCLDCDSARDFSLAFLEKVHIALREWYRNTRLVEPDFDLLLQLEEQVPLVLDLNPRPKREINTAVCHFL